MDELTLNKLKVYNYLKDKGGYVSPTEIGLKVGDCTKSGLQRHSAWASPICKRLQAMNLVIRNDEGWYKAK